MARSGLSARRAGSTAWHACCRHSCMSGSVSRCAKLLGEACLLVWVCPVVGLDTLHCQDDIAEMVNNLAVIGRDVKYATKDCGEPLSLSILDCAADVLGVLQSAGHFTELMSEAMDTCGDIDGSCAEHVGASLKDLEGAAINLVAAVSDCNTSNPIPSPETCAVDVVGLVDSLANFAGDTHDAILDCGAQLYEDLTRLTVAGQRPEESGRNAEQMGRSFRTHQMSPMGLKVQRRGSTVAHDSNRRSTAGNVVFIAESPVFA
uniref:Uncharacterized protein n=1 Tax=Pyrodinium bahamense TaxID=73915 RepID=A0A7S0B5V4_9DINO